jgi:ubiquinol oxidase
VKSRSKLARRVSLSSRVPARKATPRPTAPERSYRLNADFEDHAEHEYMAHVAEHPELETQPDPGSYATQYGQYGSLADLLRQIGHDERTHKHGSLINMRTPRFRDPHPAA